MSKSTKYRDCTDRSLGFAPLCAAILIFVFLFWFLGNWFNQPKISGQENEPLSIEIPDIPDFPQIPNNPKFPKLPTIEIPDDSPFEEVTEVPGLPIIPTAPVVPSIEPQIPDPIIEEATEVAEEVPVKSEHPQSADYSPVLPLNLVIQLRGEIDKTSEINVELLEQAVEQVFEIADTIIVSPESVAPKLETLIGISKKLDTNGLSSEISTALKRQIYLWHFAINACILEKSGNPYMLDSDSMALEDVVRLLKLTEIVNNTFRFQEKPDAPGTWHVYLELSRFIGELERCITVMKRPQTTKKEISIDRIVDRAMEISGKLNAPELSRQQRQVFAAPDRAAWKAELEKWSGETADPHDLLVASARYDLRGGFTNAREVAQLAGKLTLSKNEEYRIFGRAVQYSYSDPNILIYVSSPFINHVLPQRERESATVSERIMGNQVDGNRVADAKIRFEPIPSSDKLGFHLKLDGTVASETKSRGVLVSVKSRSDARISGSKSIDWTENGFICSPAKVSASNSILYRGTNVKRNIPLLNTISEPIAKSYFRRNREKIENESRNVVIRQTAAQFNREVEEQLSQINEVMKDALLDPLKEFGLSLNLDSPSTDPSWLLSSWSFRSPDGLCAHTEAPATPEGSFADMKIHESTINSFLEKLDFAGKTMSVPEFYEEISSKLDGFGLKRTETVGNEDAEIDPEEENVIIGFANENPVLVRLQDGKIRLILSFSVLKLNKQSWKNFKAEVVYDPVMQEDGTTVLVRDPIVNLASSQKVRTQITLRTVIGRLFPANKTVPLQPKFFDADERFSVFTIGNCRIENGWFAVAVLLKDDVRKSLDELVLKPQNDSREPDQPESYAGVSAK